MTRAINIPPFSPYRWSGAAAAVAAVFGISGSCDRRNQCLRITFIVIAVIATIMCAVGAIVDGIATGVVNGFDKCGPRNPDAPNAVSAADCCAGLYELTADCLLSSPDQEYADSFCCNVDGLSIVGFP